VLHALRAFVKKQLRDFSRVMLRMTTAKAAKPLLRYSLQAAIKKLAEVRPMAPQPHHIETFLRECHRRKYPSKAPIIRPGDIANTLYYVIEGSLAVMTEDEEGRELILAYVNAGDFIGEMGIFMEPEKREVLVRTRTTCELAEISYERLFALFDSTLREEAPRILFMIGTQLTKRLLHTSRKVSRLAFMDVTSRIATTLVDLCQEPDAMSHPKGTQIRVSRQEISRIVGCSREMVGRVLKQLEEEGRITAAGKTMVVFDAEHRPH
jgi:CRP/FNR family transcriptional regulator, cyclic AMP receptor protein